MSQMNPVHTAHVIRIRTRRPKFVTVLPVFVAECQNEVLYPVTVCHILTQRDSTVPTDAVWRAEVNRKTKVTSNDAADKPAVLLRRIWQGWVHMSVVMPSVLTAA